MEKKRFYSNGKFLLSGEYLVLKGARALAVPLKFGQDMVVYPSLENQNIIWTSKEDGKPWFRASFDADSLETIETDNEIIAGRIRDLFLTIREMNPDFCKENTKPFIETNLGFKREWGMGSSSSMVVNLARWAGVDPFGLYDVVFGGSGYDVAAAASNTPLQYTIEENTRLIRQVHFSPPFRKNIFFAYSGQKKDSREGIKQFMKQSAVSRDVIDQVSLITDNMTRAISLREFNAQIKEHEGILSGILGEKPIKEKRFPDFPGEMKSLGAWGGDFFMLGWAGDKESLYEYLKQKGISVVFSFDDIVLS